MRRIIIILVVVAVCVFAPVEIVRAGGGFIGGGFIGGGFIHGGDSFLARGNDILPTHLWKDLPAVGAKLNGTLLMEYTPHGTKVTVVVSKKEAAKRGVNKIVSDTALYSLSYKDYKTLTRNAEAMVGLPDAYGTFTTMFNNEGLDSLMAVIDSVKTHDVRGDITVARITIKFVECNAIPLLHTDKPIEVI